MIDRAGQQSRIDCVRSKNEGRNMVFRHHHIMNELKFVDNIKRQDKVNVVISYIEDDFTALNIHVSLLVKHQENLHKKKKIIFR